MQHPHKELAWVLFAASSLFFFFSHFVHLDASLLCGLFSSKLGVPNLHQMSLKHVNWQLGGLVPAGMGIFALPGCAGLLLKQGCPDLHRGPGRVWERLVDGEHKLKLRIRHHFWRQEGFPMSEARELIYTRFWNTRFWKSLNSLKLHIKNNRTNGENRAKDSKFMQHCNQVINKKVTALI